MQASQETVLELRELVSHNELLLIGAFVCLVSLLEIKQDINLDASKVWDVIIIGGALSGASTALMLKQQAPELKVLIVEKNAQFKRRVGESTVELSSFFLGRILGLTGYLNREHIVKQGLRFWFTNDSCTSVDDCSELGPSYHVKFPSYQVDRARLDQKVLDLAQAAGVEILRPASVQSVDLNAGKTQQLTVEHAGIVHQLNTRWVVDASGFARLLARKQGWLKKNEAHPISSVWSRWQGVKGWDDPDILEKHPQYQKRCHGTRYSATNHLIGEGWWCWWIPLQDGDVSIGIVYDDRFFQLPAEGETMGERLQRFLMQHPIASEFLEGATFIDGDVHYRRQLPYVSEQIVGDGFSLVGDAAGFIDPFYSPGMDWVAFTSCNTVDLITQKDASKTASALNAELKTSYERWFQALYQNKYCYMGDFELMQLSFRLDLGLYYFGIVSQPFKYGRSGFQHPPFTGPYAEKPFKLIRKYNQRLACIAMDRKKRGIWGRKNHQGYFGFKSYSLDYTLIPRILVALSAWLWLELREGWRTWGKSLEAVAPELSVSTQKQVRAHRRPVQPEKALQES